MDEVQDKRDIVRLTAEVVAAYVANNAVKGSEVSDIIASVHSALTGLGSAPQQTDAVRLAPAIPIKKSITPDYLISLEDGRHYKSLKRHLSGRGLTPADYRQKWGLAADYPMTAPNYAKQRSDLARSMGLGRKRSATEGEAASPVDEAPAEPAPQVEAAQPAAEVETTAVQPKRRGRPKKAA